jgi:hypothetical protein
VRKKQIPAQRKNKQNPLQRKKQNPLQRKKPDQPGWARCNSTKSDAELQKEVQERFTKLGGVGIVSP